MSFTGVRTFENPCFIVDLENSCYAVTCSNRECRIALLFISGSNSIYLVDPSVGDDFNHDLHEAVMQVPRANVPDLSPNQIAFIQKTGYVLEDQILRPCWVGVVAE